MLYLSILLHVAFTCFFNHHFLIIGTVNVERKNPIVGTIALMKGFPKFDTKKNMTMTMYVSTKIITFRVQLVSHALSASTRLLRDFISCSSFWMSSMVVTFFDVISSKFFRTRRQLSEEASWYSGTTNEPFERTE